MSRLTVFSTLTLCVLAITSLWYTDHLHRQEAKANRGTPTAFAEHIRQIHSQPHQGSWMVIEAKKMNRFAKSGVTAYQATEIKWYQHKQHRWTASAEQAEIATKGKHRITLAGNVQISRLATPSEHASRIETSKLLVDINHRTAETDQPVRMQQGHTITTAKGLRADLKTGTIDLISDIQSSYVADTQVKQHS